MFSLIAFCAGTSCLALDDPSAPYADRADCIAAHVARRPFVVAVLAPQAAQRLGGQVTVREFCGSLSEVRRIAPDAYPGAVQELAL